MDLIFMLTRRDETVSDCLAVADAVLALRVKHVGFKDVGVDRATQRELVRRIKAAGAIGYLEIVATDPGASIRAARHAAEIGVERVLGGGGGARILAALAGSGVSYYPFAGRPHGHPTRLGGSVEDVVRDCRRFARLGCSGIDLLAYRAEEAEPLALVRAARTATPGTLIVAGSIDSPARVRAVAAAGADAITIGTAVFEGTFSPHMRSLEGRVRDVVAACGQAQARGGGGEANPA
ncbi:MAG: hypothetical protein ACT4P2_17335 [Pseudomonadota bacterium]